MVKKVTVRGNRVTIMWDEEDENLFFRYGLQMFADEHFKGKRKVVVIPDGVVKLDKEPKRIRVSREFVLFFVEKAVNQSIRDMISRLEREESLGKLRKWAKDKLDRKTQKEILRNGFSRQSAKGTL